MQRVLPFLQSSCVLLAALGGLSAQEEADAPVESPSASTSSVRPGADRLAAGEIPEILRGNKVGLITNHTGRTRDGRRLIDVMSEAEAIDLVRLFSPEHGIAGRFDEKVGDAKDEKTGLEIRSLYGETRKPRAEDLEDIDVLVFDIQDIGTRFYTYISTMVGAMEVAAAEGKGFLVLDRPNPIGGVAVEGPVADEEVLDFVGYLPIAVRHGMTVGEIALYAADLKGLELELEILPVSGWTRVMRFDATGLEWVNPSPNMRSLTAALLYPGIGLLETTNLSVGRGTETPFRHIGAPWMDGERLAKHLNGLELPGIRFHPTRFTPESSKFANEACDGIRFELTDPETFHSVRTGLSIAHALRRLHEEDWEPKRYPRLLKDARVQELLLRGAAVEAMESSYAREHEDFLADRARFLIYP